ncbi:hypothetical protein MTsPCn9_02550 [Croceitalea sp. MTPC9]|uniref:glycoside hydrolase family 113 n=1 Tax=unclassified Croceitalea TaxID=2632280 RepID=UPI002B385160|nr:hypothetical protein MTsPCn6_06160 [Croceitalea sp. MTPC6]GMN15319.1 hypothetical protein MTsPCn9_02550 [Croceitalea sp. MTPC9]
MHQSSSKKEIRNILVIYFLTWLGIFILVTLRISRGKREFLEAANLFFEFLSNSSFIVAIHILFGLTLVLFWIIRYFVRIYKKKGLRIMIKQLAFRFLIPLLVVLITYKTLVFANSNENYSFDWTESVMNTKGEPNDFYSTDKMHRGMSVFGWGSIANKDATDALIKANVEWIAIIPFIDQEDETSKTVRNPVNPKVKWLSRDSVFIKSIKEIHKRGLRVQLKPHLWTFEGWRANLMHQSDEDWNTWFDSYENYMLYYAHLAEHTGVELFCIGTELKSSIKKQPERWKKLIEKIRNIYSGKLTYAANWHDEYEHIDFWNDLDFIGIQAYFPLTKNKTPDLETIEKGWAKHITRLEILHKTYEKPILFTEVGYRSDVSATIKPWEWDSTFSALYKKKSDRTQQLAHEALFKQLWGKRWFAGVYIWQWDHRSTKANASKNLDFSPRFKPAENTIAKWFGKPVEKEQL